MEMDRDLAPRDLAPRDLAQRDLSLRDIRNKIIEKRAILKRNMGLLKKEIGTNEVLTNVLTDYEMSIEALRKKKQEQIMYFELMGDYLDKITHDSELTEEALVRANLDQRSILEEMEKVKDELRELADEIE